MRLPFLPGGKHETQKQIGLLETVLPFLMVVLIVGLFGFLGIKLLRSWA